ncbi:MAG: trehalose-phosphatase [Hyphomonas sp.]
MSLPRLDTRTALFLDFDGTLAPIQSDPDTVYLDDEGMGLLRAISRQLGGALAIISGRDIRDLAARIPSDFWRAGGHGADICAPETDPPHELPGAPKALVAAAQALCQQFGGTRLEQKGPILALHYRASPKVEESLKAAVSNLAVEAQGYEVQHGKMVLEIRPEGVHKGVAVRQLMTRVPFAGRTPVMVGDDTTDEDAMAVCLELGGSAVRVGSGVSLAPHRVDDTQAVWTWLKEELA